MPAKHVYLLMVAMIATLFVFAACSEEVIPTQEPVEFQPTAAVEVDRPNSSGDDSEPAIETIAEDVPVAMAGDPDAGRNLFVSCSACHSTDDSQLVGPGLGAVYARAGSRTSLDAEAYLEQSIREPGAFVVDGFAPVMPSFDYLSDEDVQNLIAYLKSLG